MGRQGGRPRICQKSEPYQGGCGTAPPRPASKVAFDNRAGTGTGTKTIYAGAQLVRQVDRVTQILCRLPIPRRSWLTWESHPRLRGIARPHGALRFPWGRPANTSAEVPQDSVILTRWAACGQSVQSTVRVPRRHMPQSRGGLPSCSSVQTRSDPHTGGKKEVDMLNSMKSSAPEKDKSAAANAVEEIAPIAMPTLTQAEADTEMIPSLIEKVGATTIAEIDRLIAQLQEAKTICNRRGSELSARWFVIRTLLRWLHSRPRSSLMPSPNGIPRATNKTLPKSRRLRPRTTSVRSGTDITAVNRTPPNSVRRLMPLRGRQRTRRYNNNAGALTT